MSYIAHVVSKFRTSVGKQFTRPLILMYIAIPLTCIKTLIHLYISFFKKLLAARKEWDYNNIQHFLLYVHVYDVKRLLILGIKLRFLDVKQLPIHVHMLFSKRVFTENYMKVLILFVLYKKDCFLLTQNFFFKC